MRGFWFLIVRVWSQYSNYDDYGDNYDDQYNQNDYDSSYNQNGYRQGVSQFVFSIKRKFFINKICK